MASGMLLCFQKQVILLTCWEVEVSDGLVPGPARREAAMCSTRTIPRLATIFPHALQTRANIVRSVTKKTFFGYILSAETQLAPRGFWVRQE